jgi:hypothetical protein
MLKFVQDVGNSGFVCKLKGKGDIRMKEKISTFPGCERSKQHEGGGSNFESKQQITEFEWRTMTI